MNKIYEKFAEKLLLLSAIVSISLTILIFGFMLILGLPLMTEGNFFNLFTQPWSPHQGLYGIYPMIIGTIAISFLSIVFAFPLSLGCASLISLLGPRWFSKFFRKIIQFMTGIPTVIYGFIGIFLLVPIVREIFQGGSGMCILSASLMLTILVSPTMILFFVDSFDQVPKTYIHAIDALGGSKVQKLLHVIFPHAWRGILAGLTLGLGRAFGDTLISLMIAGNAIQTPDSVLDSARTLTAHIALVIASDYESMEFRSIYACGITLYIFTTITVLGVRFLRQAPKEF